MAGKRKKHCAAGQGRQSAALLLGSLSTCDARCTIRRCGRRAALPAGGCVSRRSPSAPGPPAGPPGIMPPCSAPIWASNRADAQPHLQRGNRVDGDIPRQRLSARSKCLPTWQGIRWRLAVRQGTAPSMAALSSPSGLSGSVTSDGCAPVVCSVVSPVASPSGFSGQRRIGRLRPGIFRCRIAAGVTLRLFRRRRVRGLHIIGLAQLPYL